MWLCLKKWLFGHQAGIYFELCFSNSGYELPLLIRFDFYLKYIIFSLGFTDVYFEFMLDYSKFLCNFSMILWPHSRKVNLFLKLTERSCRRCQGFQSFFSSPTERFLIFFFFSEKSEGTFLDLVKRLGNLKLFTMVFPFLQWLNSWKFILT